MRMKKLMILAVAAIALAACSRTFEHHATEPTQIGFSTWTEQLTKARDAGTSTFVQGDDFAVYGVKTKTSPATTETVFNGDVVTLGATTWDYPNHRYWDVNFDSYTFYAVSPATLAGTVTPATGEISTTVAFAGNNNDILVADEKTVNKTNSAGNFGNGTVAYAPVELVFNHAASLVDVYVKKAPVLHDDAVTVSAFSLDNIKSAGSLHVDTYTAGVPTIAVANWTPTANATDTYEPGDGADQVDISSAITIGEDTAFNPDQTTANTYTGAVTPLIKQLVVMPQTFVEPAAADRLTQEAAAANTTAQKITITYTIGSNPATTATLWLYDFDHIDNTEQAADYVGSWAPGKHYKFYITILANAISFTATINDWDATTIYGYNYLVK